MDICRQTVLKKLNIYSQKLVLRWLFPLYDSFLTIFFIYGDITNPSLFLTSDCKEDPRHSRIKMYFIYDFIYCI